MRFFFNCRVAGKRWLRGYTWRQSPWFCRKKFNSLNFSRFFSKIFSAASSPVRGWLHRRSSLRAGDGTIFKQIASPSQAKNRSCSRGFSRRRTTIFFPADFAETCSNLVTYYWAKLEKNLPSFDGNVCNFLKEIDFQVGFSSSRNRFLKLGLHVSLNHALLLAIKLKASQHLNSPHLEYRKIRDRNQLTPYLPNIWSTKMEPPRELP